MGKEKRGFLSRNKAKIAGGLMLAGALTGAVKEFSPPLSSNSYSRNYVSELKESNEVEKNLMETVYVAKQFGGKIGARESRDLTVETYKRFMNGANNAMEEGKYVLAERMSMNAANLMLSIPEANSTDYERAISAYTSAIEAGEKALETPGFKKYEIKATQGAIDAATSQIEHLRKNRTRFFEPSQVSLESRVNLLLLVGLGVGILFQLTNITGNAIGNGSSANYAFILLIFAFLALFYRRKIISRKK